PQTFRFPNGFLIPTMWKSLTGNLLLTRDEDPALVKKSLPVTIVSADNLLLWDLAQNRIVKQLPKPCESAAIAVSPDAKTLYMGCKAQPTLYRYGVEDETLSSISLTAPVSAMAIDTDTGKLYMSHASV